MKQTVIGSARIACPCLFITCISSAVHKDLNYVAEYKKWNPEYFKRFLSVRISFTLNYLILAFNSETFVANLFSKYKQESPWGIKPRPFSSRQGGKYITVGQELKWWKFLKLVIFRTVDVFAAIPRYTFSASFCLWQYEPPNLVIAKKNVANILTMAWLSYVGFFF